VVVGAVITKVKDALCPTEVGDSNMTPFRFPRSGDYADLQGLFVFLTWRPS
jgi:hypothetical protein